MDVFPPLRALPLIASTLIAEPCMKHLPCLCVRSGTRNTIVLSVWPRLAVWHITFVVIRDSQPPCRITPHAPCPILADVSDRVGDQELSAIQSSPLYLSA